MTATILKWTKHRFVRCRDPECTGCAFCVDNIVACDVCRGYKGSTLTTDCPGRIVEDWDQALIMHGLLDYTREDGWKSK